MILHLFHAESLMAAMTITRATSVLSKMFFINSKRFELFATLLFCGSSYAELTLQSSSIFVESNALVIGNFPFPGAPRDRQGELVENFPGAYDKAFTAVSAIDGAENVATTRANVSLSTAPGVITASGTSSASTNYTKGGSTLSKGAVSNGTILFRFSWTSDGEVLYRFERTLTRSATGIGTSGPFGCDGTSCPPSEPFVLEQVLPAGTHSAVFNDGVRINGETGADASAEFNAVWSITITERAPCDLAWASASSGNFDEADNWDPQVAPGDDDSGCSNLIFDQAGAYVVTFNDGAAANSVRVLSGSPSLSGGSLALSGTDVTDGLSISNQGQLTLNAGTITARGIGVGVDPPTPSKGGVVPASLEVKAGATLSSLTSLDIARQPGTDGLLTVDGKDLPVEVSITGELIVGAAGSGELETLSKADAEARNLSLGVLPGSIGVVSFLGGPTVGQDLNDYRIGITATTNVGVGGEGRLFTRDAGELITRNMEIGIEVGGFGRFSAAGASNVTGIADELTIGSAGRGELSIESATVLAGSCQLGRETGGSGLLQIQFGGRMVVAENPELTAEGESSGEIVSYGALQIGNKSNGRVEIFDEETLLSCKALALGGVNGSAGGTLNIASGARAVIDNQVAVGNIIGGGPGVVRVANGGAMQIGTELLIGQNGLFFTGLGVNVSFSTLAIGGGRVEVEPLLEIARPTKGMTASPKGAPGPAIFDGDMEISADGTLEVPAGVGEALVVTGAATLDGTLAISLEPGVTFNNDDLLGLIDFQGGVTGSFATVNFLNAPEGFDAEIEFDGGTLQVRVINGGTATGEGEGADEGEGEGDGEPVTPGGCQGCNAAGGPATKALGDWMAAFLGLAVLLGAHLRLQSNVGRLADSGTISRY